MVGKYWIEELAGLPCSVEQASEYCDRIVCVPANTLFVTLSQSGEAADSPVALRGARKAGYLALLTICNSAKNSMVLESDLAMLAPAGEENGVASAKSFTTHLLSVLMLAGMLGKYHGLSAEHESEIVRQLDRTPGTVKRVLELDHSIEELARLFVNKRHTLFLGRGPMYPVALEGALKLNEISRIHAEGYAAGELKHGALALVDEEMPVVVLAPNNKLLAKLKSNIQVVRARGGRLFVFADEAAGLIDEAGTTVICMPDAESYAAPIAYSVALQMLAGYIDLLKGAVVNRPRKMGMSASVE